MVAEKLSARPGWAQLTRAAGELHAAEVLLGDAVAPASTAVPHLRAFWQAIVEAASAAKLGDVAPDAAHAEDWLAAEIPGLDARTRASLADHVRALEAAGASPTDKQLRVHAKAARELLAKLEPMIGGMPLLTRRRRIGWGLAGAAIVLLPVLVVTALRVDVEGEGPWRAEYFTDRKLEESTTILREQSIDHDWGKDGPLEAVPPDKFSVRWDTCLRIDQAATVTLQVNANDGARVLLDGESAIDVWDKDADTRRRGFGSAVVDLSEGVHHLRVEYFESLGTASIKLAASFDGEPPAAIPSDRLLYPGDSFDEEDPCAAVR